MAGLFTLWQRIALARSLSLILVVDIKAESYFLLLPRSDNSYRHMGLYTRATSPSLASVHTHELAIVSQLPERGNLARSYRAVCQDKLYRSYICKYCIDDKRTSVKF